MYKNLVQFKTEKFISEPPSALESKADFHFGDGFVRIPIETKEKYTLESTFCDGYNKEKYLVAISTQIGCASGCKFCELAEHGLKRNLSQEEILDQVKITLQTAKKRGYDIFSKPIKVSMVRGGEPLMNKELPNSLEMMNEYAPLQIKMSSITPKNKFARNNYKRLVNSAKNYDNTVQFQISLNSTNQEYRQSLVLIPLMNFKEIREIGELWANEIPNPRKIDLTFTINKKTPMDAEEISDILTPDLFAIRLRECLPTDRSIKNDIKIIDPDKVNQIKNSFEDSGYLIIPGSPGETELDFKMAPGQFIDIYNMMKK